MREAGALERLTAVIPSLPNEAATDQVLSAITDLPSIRSAYVLEYRRSSSAYEVIHADADLLHIGELYAPDEVDSLLRLLEGQLDAPFHITGDLNETTVYHGIFDVAPEENSSDLSFSLRVLFNTLPEIYGRRILSRILKELHRPVDYDRAFREYIDDVKELCRASTGMQMGALRRIDGDALECLFVWGPNEVSHPITQWSIPISEFSVFERVISSQEVCAVEDTYTLNEDFTARPEQEGVRSFVAIPVITGSKVYGVMTSAQGMPYSYSEAEKEGFLSIANAVGISIQNYDNFHLAKERASENAAISTALTGVEVAQAVRHEARDLIDDCFAKFGVVRAIMAKGLSGRDKEIERFVEEVDDKLGSVSGALDKIRDATQVPITNSLEKKGILEIWIEAANQVSGKLNQNNIDISYSGKDVIVRCYSNRLRQVFLNLISNSIESFKERGKKRGRRIIVSIDKTNDKEHSVYMTYSDNAGGIDRTKLYVPSEHADIDVGEVIFRKYVSSRKNGGWGLWLVRRMIDEHLGSIQCKNYRGGVDFAIILRKDPEEV